MDDSTAVQSAAPALIEGDTSSPAAVSIPRHIWRVVQAVATRIGEDRLTDLSATMTYYMLLSVFPLLLAVVSLLNLVGLADTLVPALEESIGSIASAEVTEYVTGAIRSFLTSGGAGIGLVIGLVLAVWSASKYIGSFTRALNTVFRVNETRKFFHLKALQLLLTFGLIVAIVVVLGAVTLGDPVIQWLSKYLNLSEGAAELWALRLPLVIAIIVIVLMLLYWFAPSLKRPARDILSPGAAAAILLCILAGRLFNVYLSVFNGAGTYAKTYGALAGVVVVLMLMWLMNLMLLLGAEIDSWRHRRAGEAAKATDVAASR
jgi:membrane protein